MIFVNTLVNLHSSALGVSCDFINFLLKYLQLLKTCYEQNLDVINK